jgi:hypothetical protein
MEINIQRRYPVRVLCRINFIQDEEYSKESNNSEKHDSEENLQLYANKTFIKRNRQQKKIKLSQYHSACPLKVLYVDQNDNTVKLMVHIIQKIDIKIRTTQKMTEEVAIGIARGELFDIIILEEDSIQLATAGILRLNGYVNNAKF